MTYATQQNMVDRFGSEELVQLTDRDNLGVIDATVLGQALADSDTEINSYLASVCSLPLVTVPPRLTKIAADIARYELYGARCTEQVRQRYTDAIAFLKMVKTTGVSMLGLDSLNQPVPETGGVGMTAKTPVFDAAGLSDY